MKRFVALVGLSLSLLLMGCAMQQIPLQDRAKQSYEVSAGKLIFDDLSVESKIYTSDSVYVNGWAPMHSGFTPPLNKSFVSKLKNSIVASGSSGRVEVAVLRVGFFVQQSVAEDIVLVGFFMLGKDRGVKCDADVNIKTGDISRRLTLAHEVRRRPFSDVNEVREFVEDCQTDLVRQLSDEIERMI